MAVYLIDFENVTSAGISGIQRLTKEDKVYIFYTVNASNMSFAAHMNLLSSPAEVIYYNVTSGGKNALDFQLASFLGYLISKGEDKDFYIISNDKGYDHVKNFWERSGITEGVTIHSSPSINRSLIPNEKPFTSKIQQSSQQSVTMQSGLSLEQLEQMKAETDKYTEQKKAAEAAAKEANEGNTAQNTEKDKADTEKKTTNTEKIQPKSSNDGKDTAKKVNEAETEQAAEEKPVKRRGRPKKQVTEVSEVKAEKPAKAEKADAKTAKAAENTAKPAAKKAKTSPEKGKSSAKKGNDSDALKNALRPLLAKAKIKSEDEVANVANYFKLADGKQQFYRNLITLFGMERGVEIYRVIRTEYTNLTKLVKQ